MRKYYFIGGMPRSGSTLLSSILNQNPKISAGVTSPVTSVVDAMLRILPLESPDKVVSSIRGMFDGYYADSNQIVFDTNRGWNDKLHVIKQIFPYTKIIYCVRDIVDILNSYETLHRSTPMRYDNANTKHWMNGRIYDLMSGSGHVYGAYEALMTGICSNESDMILLVEYNSLCSNPDSVMKRVYEFIDEPYYKHDFMNVVGNYRQYDIDNDLYPSMHEVRPEVKCIPKKDILHPEIINQYKEMEIWRDPKYTLHRI